MATPPAASSARPVPSNSADARCRSRCRSIAQIASAASIGAPCASRRMRMKRGSGSGVSTTSPVAITPAATPANRRASRNTPTRSSSPAVRASTAHSSGAASPNGASTVVSTTGRGFHDAPPVVSRSSRLTSRPHTIQVHGSKPIATGSSNERTANPTHVPTTVRGVHGDDRRASAGAESAAVITSHPLGGGGPPVGTHEPHEQDHREQPERDDQERRQRRRLEPRVLRCLPHGDRERVGAERP